MILGCCGWGAPWPPDLEEGPTAAAARRLRRFSRLRARRRWAGPSVGGAGDGGKEKTARRWMGGAVAGSISVVAEAA